jgi:hypothetical protein
MLELIDHQTVAVAAEALEGNRRARHIATQALQLSPVAGLANDRRIGREAATLGGR